MPDSLYDTDIMTWSEQQAARLRRLAMGERVNDVDWPNVIEEIESLGRSELNRVRSFLRLAMLHAMKLVAWPEHSARHHWRIEVENFLTQAAGSFEPSMRQHIDIADLHARALRDWQGLEMDGAEPLPVMQVIDWNIADRLPDIAELIALLTPPSAPPTPR